MHSKIGKIGTLLMTAGISEAVKGSPANSAEVMKALTRYTGGDWGDLGEDDKALNDKAVRDPGSDRILAKYSLSIGDIYIITEWDRSYTTILFCNEY